MPRVGDSTVPATTTTVMKGPICCTAAMPAIPPVVSHVGLRGEVPDLPHEVVLHGDPLIVVRTGGQAPAGGAAWTLLGRGRLAEDIVTALAAR